MNISPVTYVFQYYSHLMTEHERLAYRHLVGTMKATLGRSDVDAQKEAKSSVFYYCRKMVSDDPSVLMLSDDPDVLLLACDGIEAFVLCTGRRILNDHRDQIVFNCCPRCGAVARTPTARQCPSCRYDWHYESGTQPS
jgi:hypothetical protein